MQQIFIIMLLAVLSGALRAQGTETPNKPPTFDVVSIRENKNDSIKQDFGASVDGYHGQAISPLILIVTAFSPSDGKAGLFDPSQIEGMPDWVLRGRYDIEAKVSHDDMAAWKRPDIQSSMLQQVLADRFKLATHRELREKPVFDLVVAKGGPKFKPSETPDMNSILQKYPTASALPGGIAMVRGPKPQQRTLINATIADFGAVLGKGGGRPIVDKTGLMGRYDITLELDMTPGPDGARPDPTTVLINALQEIGLKLEPAKEKVEVLVVDHVERPSDN